MIGYVASHSVHQPFSVDNQDLVLPTLTSAGYLWPLPVGSGTLLNPNVGTLRAISWDDTGTYNGLHVQVTKKMSHGFQAQASYTWGKCFDQGSGASVADPYVNSIASLLYFSGQARRGLCDYNVGNAFVLNYVWDIPAPTFGGAGARFILGGWEGGGSLPPPRAHPFPC